MILTPALTKCTKHRDQVISPFYKTCPRCEGEFNRERVDKLAEVIRALKATVEKPISDSEHQWLVGQLDELGHPNKSDLLTWIAEAKRA